MPVLLPTQDLQAGQGRPHRLQSPRHRQHQGITQSAIPGTRQETRKRTHRDIIQRYNIYYRHAHTPLDTRTLSRARPIRVLRGCGMISSLCVPISNSSVTVSHEHTLNGLLRLCLRADTRIWQANTQTAQHTHSAQPAVCARCGGKDKQMNVCASLVSGRDDAIRVLRTYNCLVADEATLVSL